MMTQDCSLSAGKLVLQQGMTAARAGFKSLATVQLERAAELLLDNPTAWLWLAWLANSPDNSRHCLQRVLELRPGHPTATAGLIWVNSLTADEPVLARVDVVDEPALIQALKNKTIYSAGLDVFAKEPQVPKELIEMDHVVLFPHLGSSTEVTRAAMDQLLVDNILAWASGKPPLTPVSETPYPPKR